MHIPKEIRDLDLHYIQPSPFRSFTTSNLEYDCHYSTNSAVVLILQRLSSWAEPEDDEFAAVPMFIWYTMPCHAMPCHAMPFLWYDSRPSEPTSALSLPSLRWLTDWLTERLNCRWSKKPFFSPMVSKREWEWERSFELWWERGGWASPYPPHPSPLSHPDLGKVSVSPRCKFNFIATAQPPATTKEVTYSINRLLCWLINKPLWGPLCLRGTFYLLTHIKRSVLYLLRWSRRLRGCSEIKVVSPEAWSPMVSVPSFSYVFVCSNLDRNNVPTSRRPS